MASHKDPRQSDLRRAIVIFAFSVVLLVVAVVLAGCGNNATVTSSPQLNTESEAPAQPDKSGSSDKDNDVTDPPKQMTKADQAARDSLIIDVQARGFTYIADQTQYNPQLDTSDTGGLSTNIFVFTIKVGDCQPTGTIKYTKVKGAAKFVIDDWSAKLTIGSKTVGNVSANIDALKKRALLWSQSNPEIYQCLTDNKLDKLIPGTNSGSSTDDSTNS